MVILAVCWTGAVVVAQDEGAASVQAKDDGIPVTSAMWERDFDLLLDSGEVPGPEALALAARKADLEAERDRLQQKLDDLRQRQSSIQGSYTTEALLEEMLRQDAHSLQAVQANLAAWIQETEAKLRDVDRNIALLKQGKRG